MIKKASCEMLSLVDESMKDLSVLAIIPARGGSKGIRRKNIRQVAGLPLLAHSVRDALKSRNVSRVVVSTDDTEIASLAERYGAEVVRRPAEISGDKAPTEAALLHVLDHLHDADCYEPDLVVFLQATSPCRRPEDIDRAVLKLLESSADSCFSACPEHFTGRWRIGADGNVTPVNFELGKRPMRQDYGIEYLENGNIYVFKPWVLRETGDRLGGKIAVYPMGVLDSLQIDSPNDLELLEQVLQMRDTEGDKGAELSILSAIRLLVLDFDGVMTNNTVLVDQDGREAVFCHRGDGWGLAQLKENGIQVFVLSTEKNPVVAARCRKLQIECIQSSDNKLSALEQIANRLSLEPGQIAYVGNDVNDLECMKWVGAPIAPSDAVPEILAVARFVTPQPGGAGVVRQVADRILAAQTKEDSLILTADRPV